MTYRDDRVVTDDTGVVERERVVEREVPVATTPVAPANAVNVNSAGYATAAPGPLYYARRLVILVFGIILAIIAIRFILLALGANADNGLVSGIYNISEWFVAPFRGILRIDEVQAGISALDFGAIVALVGWLIIEVVVIAVVRLFRPSATA
jgi:hypothetical protein